MVVPTAAAETAVVPTAEFPNLKRINLLRSGYLVELPDLSKAPKLVHLILACCYSLRHIHPSTLSHPKLEYLFLACCEKIESLTNDIHLKSVNDLQQECCSSLQQFSATTEALEPLELSIHPYCCNLKTLPHNIGLQSSLQYLLLSATNVQRLPSNIKKLSMLQVLHISDCKKLVFVPELPPSLKVLDACGCTSLEIIFNLNTVEIVDGLPSLRSLDLTNCCNLQILPDSIGLLSSLENLNLRGTNVEWLPSDIKKLSMLYVLNISYCKKLVFVPELPPSLGELYACDCTSLEIIVNLNTVEIVDGLPSLRRLDLSCCCNLQILPDSIGLLSSLEDLDLSGTNVESLPSNIKNLSMLQKLNISDCRKLVFVPELPPYLKDFKESRPRNQMQDEKDSVDCFMGEGTKERGYNDDGDDLPRERKKELLLGGISQYNLESDAQSLNKQESLPQTDNLENYNFQANFDELRSRNYMQEVIHPTITVVTKMLDEKRDLNEKDLCGCLMGLGNWFLTTLKKR